MLCHFEAENTSERTVEGKRLQIFSNACSIWALSVLESCSKTVTTNWHTEKMKKKRSYSYSEDSAHFSSFHHSVGFLFRYLNYESTTYRHTFRFEEEAQLFEWVGFSICGQRPNTVWPKNKRSKRALWFDMLQVCFFGSLEWDKDNGWKVLVVCAVVNGCDEKLSLNCSCFLMEPQFYWLSNDMNNGERETMIWDNVMKWCLYWDNWQMLQRFLEECVVFDCLECNRVVLPMRYIVVSVASIPRV